MVALIGVAGCSGQAPSPDAVQTATQAAQLPTGSKYVEAGGEVVIEAEKFNANIADSGQSWQVISSGTASGGEAMQALPDSGAAKLSNVSAPELRYVVNFTTTGTYNVVLRGQCASGTPTCANSDSVHIGIDGVYSTADNIKSFLNPWVWRLQTLDGPNATLVVSTPGEHTISVKMREDGFSLDKIYLSKTTTVPTGTGPSESGLESNTYLESGGLLSIEAEGNAGTATGSGDTWTTVSEIAASGGSALQALPDDGTAHSSASAVANAARVDFSVNFSQTGTFKVWVLGRAGGVRQSSDSVHVGLDGALPSTSDDLQGFPTSYQWRNTTASGAATINVGSTGVHTLNVWVREDGFVFDKIVLAKSTLTFTPVGSGPAVSPTGSSACSNSTLDTGETDVDCGGSLCSPCANGKTCAVNSDCSSNSCDSATDTCYAPALCFDGIVNQDETGVDCGGVCDACAAEDVPFQETAGVASLEAESASYLSSGSATTWQITADANASGASYLLASPDANAAFDPVGPLTPRADFPVYFQTTGVFNVWVRGAATGSAIANSDSVHVGLDGVSVNTSDRVTGFGSLWGWSRSTIDGPTATINVTTPGLHSVNVWVREDGFKFDKLVLTKGSAPVALGPSESVRSSCDAGYAGNPCVDINECDLNTDNCDANAACTNTAGSFTCECNDGYSGNGVTCTDENECDLNTDNCDANATCTNTAGSFTCDCNDGYSGNGVTCTSDAVNECDLNTDNCDANATCTDTEEGFLCTCNAGYEGNGVTCATNCTLNQTCVCGNNTVEGNEVCDDGNTTAGDGCRSDCRGTEVCGDGKTDTADGEQCDDGNTTDGDGCSSTCQLPPFVDVPPASVNSTLVALEILCSLGNSNTGRKVGVDQLGRLYLAMRCGDNSDVYVTSSTDRGATWSTPVATGLTGAEELAVEGGSANFAYVIAIDSSGTLRLVRTLDAGSTWSSPSTLTTGAERNIVNTYVLSIDSAEDNVFVSVNHSGGLRVLRNFSRGIGSFDSVDVAQSSVFNDVILDKLTGWVLLPSDDPEFRIRTSSTLGVTFSAESNPAGSDYYTDWTGSGGYIYTSGVGTSLFRIPVSSPGTISSVSGLPASNNWMRAIDADALGNVYVGTQRSSDSSITLDRYISGAGSIDGADTRVIAASGTNPQVVALPTNDGAVIAYNDGSGYIWVAVEVY
jgi:cysteine-rich repeat protein